MNIRDLQYVVAVAEERHFGRAAARCHVSQPALSGQILRLEDFLGVTLFERTKRSVHVTAVGERIIAQARQLIAIAEDISATAQAARDPFSGQFRLGMIATIGPYLSPLVLGAIGKALPDLKLVLVEGFTADLERQILENSLDGVVLATVPEDPALQEMPLYDEPFQVALAKDNSLVKEAKIDLTRLPAEELLLLADGHCLRSQVLDFCHVKTGLAHANTRETGLETLLALVAAGEGVTLVPALTTDGHNRRNIVLRPETTGTAGRIVRLVCRRSYPRMELVENLAAIIRTQVPPSVVRVLE